MTIQEQIEKIKNSYNAEHDMFPGGAQVNVTDMRLLEIIEALEARLSKLEVFTGMTAPAPLPATRTIRAAFEFELEDGWLHFANGEVDEIGGAATGMDEDEELPC